ncbi:MAG: TOBE domain-containing protein [Sulfurovum sp.]
MNKIVAVVKSVNDMKIVTYITLEVNSIEIMIIKSKKPEWINVGDTVYFTFREFSVCVGTACNGKVSIENRIPATLHLIRKKGSLCELKFNSELGEVVSLMTEKAFDELELDVGSKATVLLREIDISLEPYIEALNIEDFMNTRIKVAN